MLAVVTCSALVLGFAPPQSALTRREAIFSAAATLGFAQPAFAEYQGQPPPKMTGTAYRENLEAAKEYKFSKPQYAAGEGSEAFKAAEAKRAAAKKAFESGQPSPVNTGSVDDDLARLGLKRAS